MYRSHFSNQGGFRPAGRDVSKFAKTMLILVYCYLATLGKQNISRRERCRIGPSVLATISGAGRHCSGQLDPQRGRSTMDTTFNMYHTKNW
ncbi:unnamed protein product [Periconia digitata]|uniref:Uncharacterized protein n=1 Tax=Periconia digitata TaxID=1303443 RepID=A0A9W4UN96_9PLEO|nr:unnamed protein product [Periconia digitata]